MQSKASVATSQAAKCKLINVAIDLIAIFDKGEQDNITREQIFQAAQESGLEVMRTPAL